MEQLLSMNISASILILILLMLRRLCGKLLPRKCFVWLSMVVMLRLLLPVQIPVLPNQIPTVSGVLQGLNLQERHANTASHVTGQAAQDAAANAQSTGKASKAAHTGDASSVNSSGSSFDVSVYGHLTAFLRIQSARLMMLWLCGVLICGGFFLHRLWKEYGILLQSLPLGMKEVPGNRHSFQIPLFYSDQITSPVTFGILHYSIVLPKKCEMEIFPVRITFYYTNVCISVIGITCEKCWHSFVSASTGFPLWCGSGSLPFTEIWSLPAMKQYSLILEARRENPTPLL